MKRLYQEAVKCGARAIARQSPLDDDLPFRGCGVFPLRGRSPHEQLHQDAIQRVVEVSSIEATQSRSAQSPFGTLAHTRRSRRDEVLCNNSICERCLKSKVYQREVSLRSLLIFNKLYNMA